MSTTINEKRSPVKTVLEPTFCMQESLLDRSKRARKLPKKYCDSIEPNWTHKRKALKQSKANNVKYLAIEGSSPSTPELSRNCNDDRLPFAIDHVKVESESLCFSASDYLVSKEKTADNILKSKAMKLFSNNCLQDEEISFMYDVEQLKKEIETDNMVHPVFYESNECIIHKNVFKSISSSDLHFANSIPTKSEIQHRKAGKTISKTNILSDKRVRKKKALSDDFVTSEFVITKPKGRRPKKIQSVLNLASQIRFAKNKSGNNSLHPELAPFKTNSKVKWQKGETEAEYNRRRRVRTRMWKENYRNKKIFVTSYSYWSGIEMEKLIKERPDFMDFQEIRLFLQSKWKTLSKDEKLKYRILAKQEKQKRIEIANHRLRQKME